VTFPGQPPAVAVDKVLRDCLAAAVRKDSTSDIVVTPWYRANRGASANDDEALSPYGALANLVYEAASKTTRVKTVTLVKAAKPVVSEQSFDNFGGLTAMTRQVRGYIRDPDSFEVIKYGRGSSDGTQCMSYRSRDGFGGMNIGYAVVSSKQSEINNATLFKKLCRGL
jgi:hypothetical protein